MREVVVLPEVPGLELLEIDLAAPVLVQLQPRLVEVHGARGVEPVLREEPGLELVVLDLAAAVLVHLRPRRVEVDVLLRPPHL